MNLVINDVLPTEKNEENNVQELSPTFKKNSFLFRFITSKTFNMTRISTAYWEFNNLLGEIAEP